MLGTLTKGLARGQCWLSALLTPEKGFKPAEEGTGFGASEITSGSLGRLGSFLAKPASVRLFCLVVTLLCLASQGK